ncbi:MAG: MoaD/ThiS family protein, partial [Pelovirga sp.]
MPHQTALEDLKSEATLAFAGDLGSLLSRSADRKKVSYRFTRNPSVKDAIEACGVPHTEVNVILVNKQPVTFRYLLQAGDRVTVLPPRYPTEVPQNQWLAEQQLEQPRF